MLSVSHSCVLFVPNRNDETPFFQIACPGRRLDEDGDDAGVSLACGMGVPCDRCVGEFSHAVNSVRLRRANIDAFHASENLIRLLRAETLL